MSNQRIGKETEKRFADFVNDNFKGVTIRHPRSIHGQPFDMTAVFKDQVWFIDIKHCLGKRFSFRSVEPNQKTAFELLEQRKGNAKYNLGFIIYFNELEKFKYLPFETLKKMESLGQKSILQNDERLREL